MKLPLETSTLGRLNRRALPLASLRDGATVQRLLDGLVADDPWLRGRVLHADETTWLHAGSDLVGVLVRRWPTELDGSRIVPVAALAAPTAEGRTVAQSVADAAFGGDREAFLAAYLGLLVDVHVRLWLAHGVALEAHQQNTAIVVTSTGALRLLLKDNDGPRLDPDLLGTGVQMADPRAWAGDPRELCDVVTTIALHLCAAAVVHAVTDNDPDDRARRYLLAVLRGELERAAAEHADARDVGLLRAHVLDADRLPVKGMLTGGTLLPKTRTGARDINKHYTSTAPTYLPPRG
jgi:siderophore synthetase component